MKYAGIALFVLLGCQSKIQNPNRILYHSIHFTASSVKLVALDTSIKEGESYAKETLDSLNRTSKLEFYNEEGKLSWAGSGFYGGPIIKYEYVDNQIIETFFCDEREIYNDFQWSEAPYRFVYELDVDNNVTTVKSVYKIDFEFTTQSIDSTINHLKFYRQYAAENSAAINGVDHVIGYKYAKGKLHEKDPDFKIK